MNPYLVFHISSFLNKELHLEFAFLFYLSFKNKIKISDNCKSFSKKINHFHIKSEFHHWVGMHRAKYRSTLTFPISKVSTRLCRWWFWFIAHFQVTRLHGWTSPPIPLHPWKRAPRSLPLFDHSILFGSVINLAVCPFIQHMLPFHAQTNWIRIMIDIKLRIRGG